MGILIALGLSVLVGFLFTIDPAVPEIMNRTKVGPGQGVPEASGLKLILTVSLAH